MAATKIKLKPVKLSAQHAVVDPRHAPVVPLNDRRLNFGNKWDYAPAPEESKNYVIAPRHELFINGKFVAPHSGKYFDTINPATEDKITEIALGDAEDVDIAVKAARRAYEKVWSKMPGRERGKYLYRIARIIQEKSRELAVLETMDGGKPIKETRDVDLPIVAAHFFYHAGWADKLQYAFPGRTSASAGRRGPDHSVEFPAADGRVENRAGARLRQHRRHQAVQDHQPHARAARADFPGGGIAGRRRQRRHRHRRHRHGHRQTSGREQNCVHRLDGNRQAARGNRGCDALVARRATWRHGHKRITLELGGKAANIVFEDAPIDQAIEGIIAGIYFNMGHVCCAGSRLLVQESIYPKVVKKLRDRIQTLRIGNPLDKNTDIGAINNKPQLEKIRELVQSGADEGAEVVQTRVQIAGARLLVSADVSDRRHRIASRGAGGNFRAGVERDDVPHAGGGGRTREQHALRFERRRVDGQGQQDFQDREPAPRRRRLGEHLQQIRPDESVRRLQGKRLRSRRRNSRAGGVLQVGLSFTKEFALVECVAMHSIRSTKNVACLFAGLFFCFQLSAQDVGAPVNLAVVATPASSYVSGDTSLAALNDGFTPRNSRDNRRGSYGNWPQTGTQWAEYDWSQPISTKQIEVYWWDDHQGVRLPKACRVKFWDGNNFIAITNASGLGIDADKFNVTTFPEITTAKLRLEMDGSEKFSTGILEWRVLDSGRSPEFPPRVNAGVDRDVMLGGKTYLSGTVKFLKSNSPAKVSWSKESGPGRVKFEDVHAKVTTATFSKPGDYVLKMTVGGGKLSRSLPRSK